MSVKYTTALYHKINARSYMGSLTLFSKVHTFWTMPPYSTNKSMYINKIYTEHYVLTVLLEYIDPILILHIIH